MRFTLKALLLAAAVFLFILAVFIEGNSLDLMLIGLALVAGALLVDDLGLGKKRLLR